MTQDQIIDNIKSFAKTIKHDGGYGYLFYNTQTSEIWWVASDGDGLEANTTPIEDIEFGFSNITGITKVYVELEAFPSRPDGDPYEEYEPDEDDWIPNPWIEVNYSEESDDDDQTHTCSSDCNHDHVTPTQEVEVKDPIIGKFKPKREFLNFVLLKRGGIRYHTDFAFLKVEQISGMLEGVILKFIIRDNGTIDVEETDTNLCSDEMIQRFIDEIDSRDVTGYAKKYVVYGLEFADEEGGKLYLEVDEPKPIDKLSSLLDELDQEENTKSLMTTNISKKSLSILDSLFGDDETSQSEETPVEEIVEEVFTESKEGVQETYAQMLIRESFEEMNREKITELTERVEKKEKDIKQFKQIIKQGESNLSSAIEDLRVLQTRLYSLKPAELPNGYVFFVSTENKTGVVLDQNLQDVVEKIAPILKLNQKAVLDMLTKGYYTIKLAKKDNLTDQNLEIDKEILKKVLNLDVAGKVSMIGFDEFEYRGDLTWHQIVDKLLKMGFEQEPEFDKLCGSNSYQSLEEDDDMSQVNDLKKSIMDMAKNIGIEDVAKQHIKDIENNQDNMTSPIQTISEFTEPTTIVIFGDSPSSSIQITDDETCLSVIIGNKVAYELGSSGFADIMTLDEYKNYYKQNKSMLEDCEGLIGGIVIPSFVGKVGITAFNEDGATGNFNLNDFILHQLDYELDYEVGIVLPEGTLAVKLNDDCSLPLSILRDEKIKTII